ncbi:NAD(P)-binding domain-containing protein [Actinoplanes sp. NPDC049316]|uniref:NAD(P)-binding domain-containing protein n=1 Tax=Actinoplanes sp. NPDC049316 TaxID=3154727 RepID=UPI00344240BA
MRTRTPAVAVLETGVMGGAMARRIAATGMPTAAWNRRRAGAEPLAEVGATGQASRVKLVDNLLAGAEARPGPRGRLQPRVRAR